MLECSFHWIPLLNMWVTLCAVACSISHDLTSNLTSYKMPLAVFYSKSVVLCTMQYIFIHICDRKGSVKQSLHFPFWQQMIKIYETDTTAVSFHISFQLSSCRCNTIWIQYSGSALRCVYSLLLLAVICSWLCFAQHLVLSSVWLVF